MWGPSAAKIHNYPYPRHTMAAGSESVGVAAIPGKMLVGLEYF